MPARDLPRSPVTERLRGYRGVQIFTFQEGYTEGLKYGRRGDPPPQLMKTSDPYHCGLVKGWRETNTGPDCFSDMPEWSDGGDWKV